MEPEQVVVRDGSVALLETILTALLEPGDEVVYAWRSFEAYPIAVAIAGGGRLCRCPSPRVSVTACPALAAAVTGRTKAVILCSPNNPTGPALRDAEVRALLAGSPRVISCSSTRPTSSSSAADDDAVVDALTLLREDPRVLVLRSPRRTAWPSCPGVPGPSSDRQGPAGGEHAVRRQRTGPRWRPWRPSTARRSCSSGSRRLTARA